MLPPGSDPPNQARLQHAHALLQAGRLEEAERIYRHLAKAPVIDGSVAVNLGAICGQGKRFAEMEQWLQLALRLEGPSAVVCNNLGVAQRELGRFPEAIASFRQGLALDPQDGDLQLNLASALSESGALVEAVGWFERVLVSHPQLALAHANLGRTLLLLGDYERGWLENEWRLRTPSHQTDQLPEGLPALEPGAVVDRLLLWREQGVGDQLMYASLLPAARRLAPTLQLRVDPRLVPLLRRSFADVAVAASGPEREPIATLPERWDAQLALGSLPLHLDPRWQGAAGQGPAFLRAEASRSQQLRRALAPAEGLLCGISWHSQGRRGEEKSLPLAPLAQALALPGVRLVSLQYGDCAAELAALPPCAAGEPLVWPPPASVDPTEDLDGLAALIAACDLVISISNTTVHLAGGLGVATWVLLPPIPDWRWGLTGERCRWYDSVRLLRQEQGGGWGPLLQRVRAELAELLRSRSPLAPSSPVPEARESAGGAAPGGAGQTRPDPVAVAPVSATPPKPAEAEERPSVAVSYEHSANLPVVLERLQLSVLLSTYQAGRVVALGSHQGQLQVSFSHFDQAMGLCRTATGLAVGSRDAIWLLPASREIAPRIAPQSTHDIAFLARQAHHSGQVMGHDLAWAEGRLWLANTLFNGLVTLEGHWSFVPQWKPPFISAWAPGDRCHLNGLAMAEQGGAPAWVTVLGESDVENGWRESKATGGCLVQVPSGDVALRGLAMPHSPRLYNGQLYLLNSGHGALLRVDPLTGRSETVAVLPGYTRGLDCFGGHAFIGLSQIRETAVFGGLPLQADGRELRCGLAIVNLSTGEIESLFWFHSGVEEIFAVCVLPGYINPVVIGPDTRTDDTPTIWMVPEPGAVDKG